MVATHLLPASQNGVKPSHAVAISKDTSFHAQPSTSPALRGHSAQPTVKSQLQAAHSPLSPSPFVAHQTLKGSLPKFTADSKKPVTTPSKQPGAPTVPRVDILKAERVRRATVAHTLFTVKDAQGNTVKLGEAFDRRDFGNLAKTYQVARQRDGKVQYDLYMTSQRNDVAPKDATRLVFSSSRPLDMRKDYKVSHARGFAGLPNPFKQELSPVARAMTTTQEAMSKLPSTVKPAQVSAVRPAPKNDYQRAWNGAVAGGLSFVSSMGELALVVGTQSPGPGSVVAMPLTMGQANQLGRQRELMSKTYAKATTAKDELVNTAARSVKATPDTEDFQFASQVASVAQIVLGGWSGIKKATSLSAASRIPVVASKTAEMTEGSMSLGRTLKNSHYTVFAY